MKKHEPPQQFWAAQTSDEQLDALARSAGMTEQAIGACKANSVIQNAIEEKLQDGVQSGVNATPTIFVEEQAVASSLEALSEAIDSRLE